MFYLIQSIAWFMLCAKDGIIDTGNCWDRIMELLPSFLKTIVSGRNQAGTWGY
jgi:hypothetical protein